MNRIWVSSKAALDLASIMVGVVVIGILGGVIGATVFAVIPWSQNEAAKQQLHEVNTAQQAYAGTELAEQVGLSLTSTTVLAAAPEGATYGDLEDLVNDGYLNVTVSTDDSAVTTDGNLCVVTTNSGEGYRAESRSATGAIFYITDEMNSTEGLPSDEEPVCLPDAAAPTGPVGPGPGPGPSTPPTTTEVVDATSVACDGTYCTYGTYKGGYPGFRLLLDDLTVPTTSTTPIDWEIRWDRTAAPFSLLTDAEIAAATVTDGGAAIRLEGSEIVLYNTESYRRVSTTQPLPAGLTAWFDYSANVPHYGTADTVMDGPKNLSVSTSHVIADLSIHLADVNETIFGSWEADFDITEMRNQLPQNFQEVVLNSVYADAGMSISQVSGNIYRLSYNPNPADAGDWAWGLKGAAIVDPVNYTNGYINLSSAIRVNGDGTSKGGVTLTAAGAPSNIYWANQVFNITGATAGSWSTTVDLAALQAFSGHTNAAITAGNFTITRIGTTSQYTVNFTGTWNVNNTQITITMLS